MLLSEEFRHWTQKTARIFRAQSTPLRTRNILYLRWHAVVFHTLDRSQGLALIQVYKFYQLFLHFDSHSNQHTWFLSLSSDIHFDRHVCILSNGWKPFYYQHFDHHPCYSAAHLPQRRLDQPSFCAAGSTSPSSPPRLPRLTSNKYSFSSPLFLGYHKRWSDINS